MKKLSLPVCLLFCFAIEAATPPMTVKEKKELCRILPQEDPLCASENNCLTGKMVCIGVDETTQIAENDPGIVIRAKGRFSQAESLGFAEPISFDEKPARKMLASEFSRKDKKSGTSGTCLASEEFHFDDAETSCPTTDVIEDLKGIQYVKLPASAKDDLGDVAFLDDSELPIERVDNAPDLKIYETSKK